MIVDASKNGRAGISAHVVRLSACEAGAIAPLFALLVVTLVGVAALALDFNRATDVKGRLADAADTANLAAARAAATMASADTNRSKSDIAAEAEQLGKLYFSNNTTSVKGAEVLPPEIKVNYDNGVWTSQITYTAKLGTTLANVVGVNNLDIAASAKASVAPAFPVLDIAMCIDSTGSMTPTLDAVKNNAMTFYDRLNTELNSRGIQPFPLVRVRMIYFKDYGDINPGVFDIDAQRISPFFALPSESGNFSSFASPQMAGGGGDTPESGLECLNEAMDSPWMQVGDSPSGFTEHVTDVYPLIVVWTDAPSHPLPFPNSLANSDYPSTSKMPRNYSPFLAKWNSASVIDQDHKQILFFGDPDVTSADQGGYESGWAEVKTWPKFVVGGTLTEGNTSMIEFLATGVAKSMAGVAVTQ